MDDCLGVFFFKNLSSLPIIPALRAAEDDGVVDRDDHPYYPWCITGLQIKKFHSDAKSKK